MNRHTRKYSKSFSMLLALVATAIAGVSTQAAAAKAPEMDEEVVRWFEERALEEVKHLSSEKVVLDGEGFSRFDFENPQFGSIFTVHTWTPEFIDGKEGAEATRPIEQWVAPLFENGKPAGTIAAWRDPTLEGKVALAYFDDDAEAGAALAGFADDTHLILDPPLSSYFALENGSIRALTGRGRLEIEKEMPIADYQSILVERYASGERPDPKEGFAGGGAMIPSSVARADLLDARFHLAGVGIALAGLLLLGVDALRRRRSA